MSRKLQVTVPKSIAEQYGIEPGDEVEWLPAPAGPLVVPAGPKRVRSPKERLTLFEQATRRQREREAKRIPEEGIADRGWKREDLYGRAQPD